ncbi:hypothetical protein BCR34DRAFT_649706 [Clohesyomyces aquaticus]|uniref:Copper-fist domain-containing protein n=1 Tax=Clohesyomyces aquaticus TaxID=1231657 RepID=A0A1Y1ZSH7_9PLEO|nr:hypothetical protein BCR34DRAFT_649706 [Clohesyomyces aquaticus]
MWAEINGERKKVACGPCIRGHRSSKCDHRDRVLVEVRKPGRPLSSCPHASGNCSCERVVINYTIPKTSECACPSDRAQSSVSLSGTNSRVQKSRSKKSTTTLNTAALEKAIQSTQEAEIDSSSHRTTTATNPSIAPSDTSASNGASPASSASSTPRLQPSPSRKQSLSSDIKIPELTVRPMNQQPQQASSCCQPKRRPSDAQFSQQLSRGSCCSIQTKELPKAAPKKSCCGGPEPNNPTGMYAQMNRQPGTPQGFEGYGQRHHQSPFPYPAQNGVAPGFDYMANLSGHPAGRMGAPLPMNFNTPIYNHLASGYQQPGSIPINTIRNGTSGHTGANPMEHNCHCGDSCSCFGCAAHPNNATMTEYIRMMHHYMNTGGFGALPPPTYDLPTYPHDPGFGAEGPQRMAFTTAPVSVDFSAFQTTMGSIMSLAAPDMPVSQPWQPAGVRIPVQDHRAAEAPLFDINRKPDLATSEAAPASPTFVDSPSEGKDEDIPTLSPSSYFWQEIVLPGCNDATGTCQCGDGCECVGCLTHGGHNGVPLDSSPTTMTPTNMDGEFSQLLAGSPIGHNVRRPSQLGPGAFAEAPT